MKGQRKEYQCQKKFEPPYRSQAGVKAHVGELANSVSDASALKRKSALNRRRAHSPTCVSKSAPKRVHWTSE
jgi:hypothetical protein